MLSCFITSQSISDVYVYIYIIYVIIYIYTQIPCQSLTTFVNKRHALTPRKVQASSCETQPAQDLGLSAWMPSSYSYPVGYPLVNSSTLKIARELIWKLIYLRPLSARVNL